MIVFILGCSINISTSVTTPTQLTTPPAGPERIALAPINLHND